jgi:hypothetical protein
MRIKYIYGEKRRLEMRKTYFSIILFAFCGYIYTTNSLGENGGNFAPVEASLAHINQKVASHYLSSGVPDGFNEAQYKNVVKEVCYSNPSCKSQAEVIFKDYGIRARKIDEMFSVMLCDKDMKWKVMEDFSCNNMRVEVKSWKNQNKVPCDFENDWMRIKRESCRD